jgi:hypothetical protein
MFFNLPLLPLQTRKPMTLKLDYQQEIQRTFDKISPVSSGGRKRQTIPKDPPHFSIVTYIEDNDQRQFQEVIDKIRLIPEHKFRWALNLHCTLLSTQGMINSHNVKTLYDTTREFFERINIEQPLKVEFSLIHPGEWENDHPTESDGTVIDLAKQKEGANNCFLNVMNELLIQINNALDIKLEPKCHNTIWCTLGYFDENDFPIDPSIFTAFNNPKLREFNHIITVNNVAITEFRLKSLDDGIKRWVIRLQ